MSDDESKDRLLLAVKHCLDSWILDSGVSFHNTVNHIVFENYISCNFYKVYLADSEVLEIIGMGNARIRMLNYSVSKLTKSSRN